VRSQSLSQQGETLGFSSTAGATPSNLSELLKGQAFIPSLIQLPPKLWRIFASLVIMGPKIDMISDTYFCKLCIRELGGWGRGTDVE